MKDRSAMILIVLAVAIVGLYFLGKERLDNPLFFLAMLALFVSAFQAVGRWTGAKIGSPGLVTFMGGK